MAESQGGSDNNNVINYYDSRNEETYEQSWTIISEKVILILTTDARTKMAFEPLNSRIYRHVTTGYAERMYDDLMSLCTRHVNELYNSLCPPNEITCEHLIKVGNMTREYLIAIKNLAGMFSLLNRFYVAAKLSSSLFTELGELFNRRILAPRMPILMYVAEEALRVPCSFSPAILYRFFNDVNETTEGRYATRYPRIFSKYCLHVLPPMRESDLENHIAEVQEFQSQLRGFPGFQFSPTLHGTKRPAEDDEI